MLYIQYGTKNKKKGIDYGILDKELIKISEIVKNNLDSNRDYDDFDDAKEAFIDLTIIFLRKLSSISGLSNYGIIE